MLLSNNSFRTPIASLNQLELLLLFILKFMPASFNICRISFLVLLSASIFLTSSKALYAIFAFSLRPLPSAPKETIKSFTFCVTSWLPSPAIRLSSSSKVLTVSGMPAITAPEREVNESFLSLASRRLFIIPLCEYPLSLRAVTKLTVSASLTMPSCMSFNFPLASRPAFTSAFNSLSCSMERFALVSLKSTYTVILPVALVCNFVSLPVNKSITFTKLAFALPAIWRRKSVLSAPILCIWTL